MEYTGARVSDLPTVEVSTWVSAGPEQVWRVVSDVTAMPDASDELQSVERLDTGPIQVGSRFRGHSYHRALGAWSTVSTVIECDQPSAFAWAVEDVDRPTATWRFTLRPDSDGTLLTYVVRMGPGRSGLSLAIDRMPDKEAKIVFNRLREFERAMSATLAAFKARAERGQPAASA